MSRPELQAPPEIVCRLLMHQNPLTIMIHRQYYGDAEAKKYTTK